MELHHRSPSADVFDEQRIETLIVDLANRHIVVCGRFNQLTGPIAYRGTSTADETGAANGKHPKRTPRLPYLP